MREATHHAAAFELKENSRHAMLHTHALKQYARSSADQEFPLAHELRPEPVLQLSMQFLLHKIVGLCDLADTNLGDWFHFVWDRTRSIRKDISQQELCSVGAVNLVEQCARLHIHCAGRLVAEEPQVFDSKINSENLTKCLQSLKYLYHDLKLRSVSCTNEAEFRAYVVLLNLNDCQFFWDVKQLPAAILHSGEIQFAIKVYLALESNNYVRFFRLVRETTYMNACILLRYFTQVRVSALEMMIKTYAPRSAVVMELSYWQYVLAFEDLDQAALFFEYYGLQCDRDADRLVLDRVAFVYPDLPFMLDRAINLVEHKRNCSVGDSIHGKALPDFQPAFDKYTPHDSFDEDGYLYAEAWTADDQAYARVSTPKTRISPCIAEPAALAQESKSLVFKMPSIPPTKSPQPVAKPSIFTKLGKKPIQVIDQVPFTPQEAIIPVGSAAPSKVNRNIFASANLENVASAPPVFALNFGATTQSTASSAESFSFVRAPNIFGGPFAAAALPKPPSINESLPISTTTRTTDPVETPIPAQIPIVPQHDDRHKLLTVAIDRKAADLSAALIDEFLQDETISIIDTEVGHHKATLATAVESAATNWLSDVLDQHITDEINAIAQTLLSASRQTNTAKYFQLWRRIVRTRIDRRHQIANTPLWIEPQRTRADLSVPQQHVALSHRQRYRQGVAPSIVLPQHRERPIDVCSIVLHCTPPPQRMHLYWKCLLSIPSEQHRGESRMHKWLQRLFQRRAAPTPDVFFCEKLRAPDKSAAVCLRLLLGTELIDSQLGTPAAADALRGSHAIIFYASHSEPIADAHSRLARLQRLNVPIKHVVRHNLSSPHIAKLRQCTLDALQHLVQLSLRTAIPLELHIQRSTDFLLQTLGDQFWFTLRQSAASNPALATAMRDPRAVVAIYNEAIDKLIQIVREDHSASADFPDELRKFVPNIQINVPSTLEFFPHGWKNAIHAEQLVTFFAYLKLTAPAAFSPNLNSTADLLSTIYDYCAQQSDTNIAQQIIASIDAVDPSTIIRQFASIGPTRLSYARLSHYFNKLGDRLPSHIVYTASMLHAFCHQPWWLTFAASPVHAVVLPASTPSAAAAASTATAVDAAHEARRILKPIDRSEMDALMARTADILRSADHRIKQLRDESINGQRRRGAGADQLDAHMRGYEQQVLQQKRLCADDVDMMADADDDVADTWQRRGDSAKRPRKTGQLDVADIPASANRSFVWECYAD